VTPVPAASDGVVLFDLDGVIADSRAAITSCLNRALVANGLPAREPRELYRLIGPPLPLAFSDLLGEAPDSALVLACVASYRAVYADVSLTDTTVFPGIPEALDRVGATHRLGVATSKPVAFAEPILRALGLRDRFAAVAGPSLDSPPEDKATTVGRALHALGATEAAMVGDTAYDMLAARAHGLRAIGVAWGIGTPDELRAAGAEQVVAAPADLPAALGAQA
jgi:phosphoglycolate phosphatase